MTATTLPLGGGSLKSRVETRDGVTRVALMGHLDEAASLAPLEKLPGPLVLDLGELDRINSVGVRYWMDFVRAREQAGVTLTFERCSPMMVQQITMIVRFMGARSHVKSMLVPYTCSGCKRERFEVLETATGAPVQPTLPCPTCGAQMELDELAQTYEEAVRRITP